MITLGFEPKRMPGVTGNFGVNAVNLLAATLDDPVEADVVFKRVGANNVIVLRIDDADGNSSCLIDTTCDRLEAYGNLDIFCDDRLENGERETIVSPIRARLLNHAPCD